MGSRWAERSRQMALESNKNVTTRHHDTGSFLRAILECRCSANDLQQVHELLDAKAGAGARTKHTPLTPAVRRDHSEACVIPRTHNHLQQPLTSGQAGIAGYETEAYVAETSHRVNNTRIMGMQRALVRCNLRLIIQTLHGQPEPAAQDARRLPETKLTSNHLSFKRKQGSPCLIVDTV